MEIRNCTIKMILNVNIMYTLNFGNTEHIGRILGVFAVTIVHAKQLNLKRKR